MHAFARERDGEDYPARCKRELETMKLVPKETWEEAFSSVAGTLAAAFNDAALVQDYVHAPR